MIKFRYVYSDGKEIKTFIYDIEEIEEGNVFKKTHILDASNGFKLISRDRFIGLKDKNGTEIFIKDILDTEHYGLVEVVYDERYQQIISYPVEEGAMTVPDVFGNVWYANQFDYIWDEEDKQYWLEGGSRPLNECEVISNTHIKNWRK